MAIVERGRRVDVTARASGDTVVALGHYTATTPAGKGFDSDFAMVFTIRDGKVIKFQEFCNSAAINAAYVA
jgi:ketosteroid isomerase-like protein